MARFVVMLLTTLILASCDPPAETRARKYFRVPTSEAVNPESIRSAILAKLPIGSSASQVCDFLDRCDIGKDRSSSYSPLEEPGKIVCWINYGRVELDARRLD